MKVFVLVEESGSYSDHSTNILAVFSSEEKALEAKKALDKIKSDIEEASAKICNTIPGYNKRGSWCVYSRLNDKDKATLVPLLCNIAHKLNNFL